MQNIKYFFMINLLHKTPDFYAKRNIFINDIYTR